MLILSKIWSECLLLDGKDVYFIGVDNVSLELFLNLLNPADRESFKRNKEHFCSTKWAKENPLLAHPDLYYFALSSKKDNAVPVEPFIPYSGQWSSLQYPFHVLSNDRVYNKIEEIEKIQFFYNKNSVPIFQNKEEVKLFTQKILRNLELSWKKNNVYDHSFSNCFSMKFCKNSIDPINRNRNENFIESLNQTFSYLVGLVALKQKLLPEHKNTKFYLNIGNKKGFDIYSDNNTIIAECFAVAAKSNNGKYKTDKNKLLSSSAKYKYICYFDQSKLAGTILDYSEFEKNVTIEQIN